MYKIVFKKAAHKEYVQLPIAMRRRIDEALQLLAINPRSELISIKKLRGAGDYYRLRVGDYRIVYEVEDERLIVLIVKVGHRSDVYRYF